MLHKTEAFPVVILRLFLAYGPNQNEQRFLPQIIKGCLNEKRFPTSSGEQLRDFCYVEDVVRAIYLVFENDFVNGEILNIASGKPVSIRKIIQTVRDIIGKGEPCFGDVPYRPSENMSLYADIKKAQRLLGWNPSYSLESGLKKLLYGTRKWLRDLSSV